MSLQLVGRVFIAGTGRSVRVAELLDRPRLCTLAAEGIAWEFERRDWVRHRPSRWNRRAWRAWSRAGAALNERRDELEVLARTFGL